MLKKVQCCTVICDVFHREARALQKKRPLTRSFVLTTAVDDFTNSPRAKQKTNALDVKKAFLKDVVCLFLLKKNDASSVEHQFEKGKNVATMHVVAFDEASFAQRRAFVTRDGEAGSLMRKSVLENNMNFLQDESTHHLEECHLYFGEFFFSENIGEDFSVRRGEH